VKYDWKDNFFTKNLAVSKSANLQFTSLKTCMAKITGRKMEIITERGSTYEECVRKLHEKYGRHVEPYTRKTIRVGGFLGLFTREEVEVSAILSNYKKSYPQNNFPAKTSGQKSETKLMDFEEERQKILAQAKTDPTIQLVLNEVRDIKQKIESGSMQSNQSEDHQNILKIEELMEMNDFSSKFTRGILDRIRKEFSLEDLENFDLIQDKVVEWIGEEITIYEESGFQSRPRILVLVGPTGVGKTTTIAKLAALYGLGGSAVKPLSVKIITIDAYRIGAKEQIETYGNIMGIPVSSVDTYEELRKTIALSSGDVDLILIDTIGKSPRDSIKLGEMKKLLSVCGSQAEVHLAVCASTKSSDIHEIIQQFEPFNYRSVIVTKLDETIRVGNVISALKEKGKSISFITDGQSVPADIHNAGVVRFLINLEGFKINRRAIEERFPDKQLSRR
jgi:flagellar biosynthesis protein FlhF